MHLNLLIRSRELANLISGFGKSNYGFSCTIISVNKGTNYIGDNYNLFMYVLLGTGSLYIALWVLYGCVAYTSYYDVATTS